jgi:hypothetical protein
MTSDLNVMNKSLSDSAPNSEQSLVTNSGKIIPDFIFMHTEDFSGVIIHPAEVCDVIPVTTGTLAKWRKRGIGPNFVKFPRWPNNCDVFYDEESVREWADHHIFYFIDKKTGRFRSKIRHDLSKIQDRQMPL